MVHGNNPLEMQEQIFGFASIVQPAADDEMMLQNDQSQILMEGLAAVEFVEGEAYKKVMRLHPNTFERVTRATQVEPSTFNTSEHSEIFVKPLSLRVSDSRTYESQYGYDSLYSNILKLVTNGISASARGIDTLLITSLQGIQTVSSPQISGKKDLTIADEGVPVFKAYPLTTDADASQLSIGTTSAITAILEAVSSQNAQSGMMLKMLVPSVSLSILYAQNQNLVQTMPGGWAAPASTINVYNGIHFLPMSSRDQFLIEDTHLQTGGGYFPLVRDENGDLIISDNGSTIIQTVAFVSNAIRAYIRKYTPRSNEPLIVSADGAISALYVEDSIYFNRSTLLDIRAECSMLRLDSGGLVIVQLESGYDAEGKSVVADIINNASAAAAADRMSLSRYKQHKISSSEPGRKGAGNNISAMEILERSASESVDGKGKINREYTSRYAKERQQPLTVYNKKERTIQMTVDSVIESVGTNEQELKAIRQKADELLQAKEAKKSKAKATIENKTNIGGDK